MNNTLKRYLISSFVTFFSMFAIVVGTQLSTLGTQTITTGVVLGILTVAVRAGVKALAESYLKK